MTSYRVYNIQWEADGAENMLPSEVIITVDEEGMEEEISELLSDELSNQYDFLHNGFQFEPLN